MPQPTNHPTSLALERHLALCQNLYVQLVQTGEWPWLDSPETEEMVESEDNQTHA
ncbi:hypothetical protein [uncultured Tateyamaria sp.]|uniref:hypothetical protein n=1 Tax=uncultured Tateyamaria sp. TaxID=455651 RepID=UPI00261445B2|nr:hypothetical protein [uncultured Tateyamaria sp.]